jgi:hypothetical protein
MAGNTQGMAENGAAVVYAQEEKKRQEFIKSIADLSETETKAAIHKQANNEVGQYGEEVVAVRARHLTEDLAKYKEITPFDKVAGVFAQNGITSTTTLGGDGFAGHTAKVQQQIPLPSEAGAIWGNVSVNQDAKGNVTGGAVGVNHVGVPVTVGGVDVVEVANVTANIPKNGKFGAENVSILLGGIAKEHGDVDATNYTGAVITNGKFNDLSLYGRASKPLYREDEVEVTGYAEAIYNVPSEQLGVNAGVRADKDIGGGNSIYAQGAVNTSNITNQPEVTGNITVGFNWGGPEQKKKNEFEQRLENDRPLQMSSGQKDVNQNTEAPKIAQQDVVVAEKNSSPNIATMSNDDRSHTTISPHAHESQDPMLHAKLDHFYELSHKEQVKVVNNMTDNYIKHNPDVDREQAREQVVHAILNPQRNQESELSPG